MENIEQKVALCIEPIVHKQGCQLVEVTYEKQYTGYVLTVYIDKPGGVTLDDCEKVHMAIDAPLDELNPTNDQAYTLNVSSPGLDRPLKTDADLSRAVGEKVELHLYKQINKKKMLVGVLKEFSPETITIQIQNKTLPVERSVISKVVKYIEF